MKLVWESVGGDVVKRLAKVSLYCLRFHSYESQTIETLPTHPWFSQKTLHKVQMNTLMLMKAYELWLRDAFCFHCPFHKAFQLIVCLSLATPDLSQISVDSSSTSILLRHYRLFCLIVFMSSTLQNDVTAAIKAFLWGARERGCLVKLKMKNLGKSHLSSSVFLSCIVKARVLKVPLCATCQLCLLQLKWSNWCDYTSEIDITRNYYTLPVVSWHICHGDEWGEEKLL